MPVITNQQNPYRIALEFHKLLQQEVIQGNEYLSAENNKVLREYYHNIINRPRAKAFYAHNWAQRLAPFIPFILNNSNERIKILDAGCGTGSESIFFSPLSNKCEVLDVDAHTPHFELAKNRAHFYEANLGKILNVKFLNINIFDAVRDSYFDLIWSMESISHIHPAEEFIEAAAKALKKGGYIAISDSNKLNPVMLYKSVKIIKNLPYLCDLIIKPTGERVKTVSERLLTPAWIKKELRKNGLKVVATHMSGFFPALCARYNLSFRLAKGMESLVQRLPLVSSFGGIYTIVAKKTDS